MKSPNAAIMLLDALDRGAIQDEHAALVLIFYFACQMTEPKILAWFQHLDVQISAGEICNVLTRSTGSCYR